LTDLRLPFSTSILKYLRIGASQSPTSYTKNKKKQGRKVVILRDPCMRLWPVLYQCTPRFSGFITGWVDICRENNLNEGDTWDFELNGNSELSFHVVVPSLQ
jgi:hypothetical protein